MSRSNLAAQLRSHAKLFRLSQHSAGHAQLAQLLEDAADRIAQLESPQRAIELASATGISLERVLDVMNALGVTPVGNREPLQLSSSARGQWRESPCAACGQIVLAWEVMGAQPRCVILDPIPTDDGDTVILDGEPKGVIREDVIGQFPLYRSHFFTCPKRLVEGQA